MLPSSSGSNGHSGGSGAKRNLFELKNQNRYAQLVEAQSPEPADLDSEAPTGQQEQPNAQVTISMADLADRPEDPASRRKKSQDGSQMSASFVSTASSQHTSSGLTGYQTGGSVEWPTNLARTISRSMLELDASRRADRFQVRWRNLSFSHRPSWLAAKLAGKRATRVLHDLSGGFHSNQLVAVIGPSGCGKTTLLELLAGQTRSKRHCLTISGLEEPKVAFIGQGDCLLPGLSARETLVYASRLQNNRANFDHHAHVLPILSELGLLDCADRSVTKLSGGQAKRVTIAQELLYPTNLLVLDEITSGLDASTSYSIVRLLKQLVSDHDYPMSIIMSIHQPSARLFAVFDRVYVMGTNGGCLYEGSCKASAINAHLGRFGLECPTFHNIADYLIEIACADERAKTDETDTDTDKSALDSSDSIRELMIQHHRKQSQLAGEHPRALANGRAYRSDRSIGNNDEDEKKGDTEAERNTNKNMNNYDNDDNHDSAVDELESKEECKKSQRISLLFGDSSLYEAIERARARRERPLGAHLLVHLCRSMLRIRRSYILTYLQLLTYVFLGLQLATFYGPKIGALSGCPQLPVSLISYMLSSEADDGNMSEEMRRIQENMNFLLVAVMTATFAALEITVITFPLEAKTVKREWRNGWYRVSSYFMGRTLADLPFQLLFVMVFCLLIYSLTGQIGLASWRFGSFVLIISMTALVAQSIGFIFGAIFMDNLPAAVFTAPLCIFPALLFSGFFSRVSQVPNLYKPMTYLSHFRYAFDALLVTLYGYNRCDCEQETLDIYHASLANQTSTMRDMFHTLFGSAECSNSQPVGENSIEDLPSSIASPIATNISAFLASTSAPTTKAIKTIEDALVESVFEHMRKPSDSSDLSSTLSPAGSQPANAMDHLVDKFSTRITGMLNSRSNFGHQVPTNCTQFKSYLMTEFELHNEDLIHGLAMLFIAVILSRLLSNAILSFTMAKSSRGSSR